MNSHPVRRSTTALAAAALVAGLLSTTTPAAGATEPTDSGAGQAGRWLVGELTDGLVGGRTAPAHSLTIDVARGLEALGGHQDVIDRTVAGLAESIDTATSGSSGVGVAVKALAFVAGQGEDTSDYGGIDLAARVEAHQHAEVTGRLAGVNTFGQAYAARGLSAAGSPAAPAVTDYLLDQQCEDGFFRLFFPAATAADQTCDGAARPAPHVDATAIAALELVEVAADDPQGPAADAVERAATWLEGEQQEDGSFADPFMGPNTNTTGLAGWLLHVTGRKEAARRAARWVREHQLCGDADCGGDLAIERGAIGYDARAVQNATTGGALGNRYQWQLATAQAAPALLALAEAAPAPPLLLTAPSGYRRAGSVQALTVAGLEPGATAHLTGPGVQREIRGGPDDTTTVRVRLPGGTGDRTFTVAVGQRTAHASIRALAPKRFGLVTRLNRVRRGGTQRIVVRGLADRELVRVRYRNRTVATGHASRQGRFRATFRVGRRSGTAAVRAVGQFPSRARVGRFVVR